MSCMLTAEPGTRVEWASELEAGFEADCADEAKPVGVAPDDIPASEPPAATGSSEVPAVCCCQKRMASGRNPVITSGVSKG